MLGHFHERVGESPRQYENFGASGSKKSLFVPEIRPFEFGIVVRPNFTCKIWTLLMGYNKCRFYKGLNTSGMPCDVFRKKKSVTELMIIGKLILSLIFYSV